MITINLLPEEFRIKEVKRFSVPGLPVIIVLGALFCLLTAILYVDYLHSKIKLAQVQKEWNVIRPQSDQVKKIQDEIEKVIKPEALFLNSYVAGDKPLTYVLAGLSEKIPDTAWLTELKIDRMGDRVRVFVKGLVLPSEEKSSIELIEAYMREFKDGLGVGTMSLTTTRQQLGESSLTLFTANFEWVSVKAA